MPTPQNPLHAHLTRLLNTRTYPKTICPSEVARALSASELQVLDAREWRDVMPAIREIVWEMRDRGEVEIMQKGEVLGSEIGLEDVRGPIRLRSIRRDEA